MGFFTSLPLLTPRRFVRIVLRISGTVLASNVTFCMAASLVSWPGGSPRLSPHPSRLLELQQQEKATCRRNL
eukprot:9790552-Prorocentrum_lima.AAC.1